MKETWTLYEVWGCDTGTYPVHSATFIDLKTACTYAKANYGRIHYHMPDVYEVTYTLHTDTQLVEKKSKTIPLEQIHYMAQI